MEHCKKPQLELVYSNDTVEQPEIRMGASFDEMANAVFGGDYLVTLAELEEIDPEHAALIYEGMSKLEQGYNEGLPVTTGNEEVRRLLTQAAVEEALFRHFDNVVAARREHMYGRRDNVVDLNEAAAELYIREQTAKDHRKESMNRHPAGKKIQKGLGAGALATVTVVDFRKASHTDADNDDGPWAS